MDFKQLHPDVYRNPLAKSYKSLNEQGILLESWKLEDGVWIDCTERDKKIQALEIEIEYEKRRIKKQQLQEEVQRILHGRR